METSEDAVAETLRWAARRRLVQSAIIGIALVVVVGALAAGSFVLVKALSKIEDAAMNARVAAEVAVEVQAEAAFQFKVHACSVAKQDLIVQKALHNGFKQLGLEVSGIPVTLEPEIAEICREIKSEG